MYAIRELFLSYRSQHVQATRDYFFQFNFNKTTHAKSYLRDLTSHYLSWGEGVRRILGGHMAFSGTERGSVVANKVQSGVDYGNLTAPEDVKNNQNFKRLSWVYCVANALYSCFLL